MRARSLMYHNVVDDRTAADLGGRGDRYTFGRTQFVAHLDAVAAALPGTRVRVVPEVPVPAADDAVPLVLTFDDGDEGNLLAAELLEERGWRGQFFVVTDSIGREGHLDVEGVRALHARGHVIGTHTATHPSRLSAEPPARQLDEWARSARALAEILGEPVTVGSVPGGYYSPAVARAAAAAGLRQLYTSEPRARVGHVEGCLILGRYTIKTNTSAETAAALAVGRVGPSLAQAVTWQAKKAGKRVGGQAYLALRRRALGLDR